MVAYPGAGMIVDVSFGVQTLAFVLLYQVDHGLTPDGIVGPETRSISTWSKLYAESRGHEGAVGTSNATSPAPRCRT